MGDMGLSTIIPMVASTAASAAPLLAGQEQAPNTTQMSQVPQRGQAQTPQGMGAATGANIDQQTQLLQLLFGLMQQIPQGGPATPQNQMQQAFQNMPQPGSLPAAQSIRPGG